MSYFSLYVLPAGGAGGDLLVQKAHSPQATPRTTGLHRVLRAHRAATESKEFIGLRLFE